MAIAPSETPRIWGIGDLNRRASLAVVRDFRGQIWTAGELTRINDRSAGNRYLELVERGGGRDGGDAHLGARCSPTKWQQLERKLAEAGVALQPGQRVVLVGCLDIGDRGQLSLKVDDVDVAALIGERLKARQDLIARLVADDLFDANRRLPLPALVLRIGLVASAGSDGHRDVMRQLEGSGFAFDVTFRSVPVEGPTAARAVRAALATFGPDDVDVAIVVRGGGAKASLDVFDQGAVAHAIATAAVPVWTGIGHTGDRSVADEVAHRSFPTPSAAGQAVVATAAAAWNDVTTAVARIARLVDARLSAGTSDLHARRHAVTTLARHQLELREQAHARSSDDLRRSAGSCLATRAHHLTMTAHHLRVSGGAELRDAERRLAAMSRSTTGAARLRCADAGVDLAAAAGLAAAGAAAALDEARRPFERAHASMPRARFDRLIDTQATTLTGTAQRVGREVGRRLATDADRAASRRAVLEAYDPHRQLARGWTLTRTVEGRLVRHATDVADGLAIVTTFADGEATSTVTSVTRNDQEDTAP